MESDDDFLAFSDSDKPSSSPILPLRKLKRLKKATQNTKPAQDLLLDVNLSPDLNLFGSENLTEINGGDFDDVEKGNESDSGVEGLGVRRALFDDVDKENELDIEGLGFKRALFDDVDKESELDPEIESLGVKKALVDEVEKENELDLGIEGLGVKRALDFDDVDVDVEKQCSFNEEEEKKKKKRRRVKNEESDEDKKAHFTSSDKKRENKGRRDRIQELRAESQRLLRETRDASFRPMPVVQKPVSSILAKIRQRKREVSERCDFVSNSSSFIEENDSNAKGIELDIDFETSSAHGADSNQMEKENSDVPLAAKRSLGAQDPEESDDAVIQSSFANHETTLDSKTKQEFRAPVDDTQDLIFDSQQSDSKDELEDDTHTSALEEVLAPSVLAMNLKLDSAPLDDSSSDEEDNDKENIDPAVQGSVNLPSSPHGDPVKAFVDDEAEEEDDSDNDLGRFPENEEEEDNMDSDELDDIIGTEHDEKPIDNEMRNELHQKWLEQQDNAGMEDLLQKLKCGTVLRERSLCEEEEEEAESEDEGEENETMDYHVSSNVVRMNLKKAREMLPLMFTDKDDVYVSSDEEKTDKRPVRRHLTRKVEEEAKFLSPAEDECSREIFGRIKKLNGASDSRKKPKITSSFNMLSIGTKTNISSKSSFLGRGSKNSLPAFQKRGSGAARAFIFERDDSNSRSAISLPDDTVEVKENRPRKVSAKFTSQNRSSSQATQTVPEETKSGPSLHEILRCPSLKSGNNARNGTVGQADAIYASFRLEQNIVKKDRNVSIRI